MKEHQPIFGEWYRSGNGSTKGGAQRSKGYESHSNTIVYIEKV